METNGPLPDPVAGRCGQGKNLQWMAVEIYFTMSLLLKDKVIFLTGGSCGIGRVYRVKAYNTAERRAW